MLASEPHVGDAHGSSSSSPCSAVYEPQIGDVDEGIVLDPVSNHLKSTHIADSAHKAGEDAGNCENASAGVPILDDSLIAPKRHTAKNELTLPDLGAQGDVLLRRASGGLLGRHFDCDPATVGFAVVVPAKRTVRQRLQNFEEPVR